MCCAAVDETDWLYCGPVFNNCSHSVITADQYHHKIEMMRRLAIKLNAAGIWPIYSTFNGFADTPYRDCPFPFDDYYTALAEVGWFRFCESGLFFYNHRLLSCRLAQMSNKTLWLR